MLDRFGISDQDWQQTPGSVQNAFTSLYHQLLMLEMRAEVYERQLAALRERLSQNSNNSSKPPSTDPPHQLKTISNESKVRKRDGQVGHRGQSRKLKAMAQVDRVIDLRPVGCNRCGHLLLGADADAACHLVSEVPSCKARVTEYRRHSLRCLACGTFNGSDAKFSQYAKSCAYVSSPTTTHCSCLIFCTRALLDESLGDQMLINSDSLSEAVRKIEPLK